MLFLFVFLFKLFIQDVEEIRFFVFYIISRPCRLKKCHRALHSLEGKRIASLVRRPNGHTPERLTTQAGFVFCFFSYHPTRDALSESRLPGSGRGWRPRARKNRQFSSRLRIVASHSDMADSFSSRDCISLAI